MIKAIIFDLDGTLLDTSKDIGYVLNQTLEEFGLPLIDIDEVKKMVGGGSENLIRKAIKNAPVEFEKIHAAFVAKYAQNDNDLTSLYEKEDEVLKKFADSGIKLCLLTNKPHAATMAVFEKFLSEFGFCEVLGQTEYYRVKPDPSSTFAILKKSGIECSECVFVGDGETDCLTAKNVGMRCISVLWGYRSREELALAGATEFAENWEELGRKILENNI